MFINYVLKNKGCPCDSPFMPETKDLFGIDDLAGATLASGVVGGLGNIVSGIFGSNAQDKANEQNYLINKENRDWQSSENEKNRQFQEMMWNKQNEYNTPLNQRKLAQAAGYNPYLLSTQSLGAGAGAAGTPSSVGAPAQPHMLAANPMSGLGAASDTFARFLQLSQSGQQVESNQELQRAQAAKAIMEIGLDAYKTGGQKQYEQVMSQLNPVLQSISWSGSFYEQQMQKEFLRMDIANETADIERSIRSMYGKETAEQTLQNLRKANEQMQATIQVLGSEKAVNEKRLGEIASQIARNYAEAFNAQKQGAYYVVSAEQMSLINKSMDMNVQEQEADFAFNTGVRKFKKEIPNRSIPLGLFKGQIGAQSVGLEVQGNKFLQYGEKVSSMVGNLFKVNFGVSTNRTNFNNLNPDKPSKMFYSGDGYYMNNGVLMKQQW